MKIKSFKTKIAVAALLVTVIVVASCKKYLDVTPVSYFDTDLTFDNPVNAQKAVLGVYSSLTGDNGYGIRLSMYYTLDDDIMMGQGSTPYPDNERRDIAHYNVTPGNTQLALPYNQLYQGIERANLCIYYIPKMAQYNSGTQQEQKDLRRLYGEALTLRAQFYTELIRNWGDVTEQRNPSFTDPDFYKPKTDRDTIYNHLLKDLETAETLVPWRTEAGVQDERITQGAVRGLRARIALYRGGYSLRRNRQMERRPDYLTYYQIAKDECAAIMARPADHKLNTSFQSVFKDYICSHKIDPSGEVIWEVAMAGGTGAYDSKLGYYNGPRWNNLGNGALTILPSYFYMFDTSDLRRDVICAPYNINSNSTYAGRTGATIVDGKFRRDWINPSVLSSSAQYFGVNWPILRFSDVLLMFAEADNELNGGPTADAKLAYEAVRKRAFVPGDPLIGVTPTTYSTFFDAVVKERALELGGEGIRKYDLIRWNMLGSRIAQVKAQLAVMATRTGLPWSNYPATMYYNKVTTAGLQWTASFYKPTLTPAPPTNTWTGVQWLGANITTTILTYYAISFQPNHSELLPLPQSAIDANYPNLTQDYGY